MNEQESAEWHQRVRTGALQSFTHYRRLLKQGGELSSDDREGLQDLLNYTEDHLMAMWQIIDLAEHKRMTRRASTRIKGVSGMADS